MMKSYKDNQTHTKSARQPRAKLGGLHLFSILVGMSLLLSLLGVSGTAFADSNPAPVQLYYVTLPETDGLAVLDAINTAANSPMYTYFSIAVGVTGTYVYYDQWEDGYAADIANPTVAEIYSGTNLGGLQIWGNGLAADGCAPNIAGVALTCTDGNDVLHAGDVIIPYNAVPCRAWSLRNPTCWTALAARATATTTGT
jgi:hypothetical protein